MSAPLFTIAVQPSSEMMLAFDAIVTVGNRIAAAIEERNKLAALVDRAIAAPPAPVPSAIAKDAAPAPATPPAPVAKAPTIDSGDVDRRLSTPEREAVVRREWPKGTSVHEVLAMVHQLPGREMTATRLGIWANQLGLRRPPKPAQQELAPPPPPAAALDPAKPIQAAPESRTDIMRRIAAVQPRAVVPPQPVPREPMPNEVRMDAMQMMQWAGARGLYLHLPIGEEDVKRVNAKAVDIGHPPIVYAPSPRPGRPS